MSKAVKMSYWNGKYSGITFLALFRFLNFFKGPWVALRWENDIVFSFALNFFYLHSGTTPDRKTKNCFVNLSSGQWAGYFLRQSDLMTMPVYIA